MVSNNLLFDFIKKIWEFIKDIGIILKPCRFSIILLVVVAAFLILADQGQDVLRALTEKGFFFLPTLWFFLALLGWATNTWYWSRIMLRFDFHNPNCKPLTAKQEKRASKVRKWMPRTLGTLAFLITALAFYKTSGTNSNMHLYFSIACLVFAAVFLLLIIVRVPMQRKAYNYISSKLFAEKHLINPFDVDVSAQAYKTSYKTLNDVPVITWIMLGIFGFISVTLFLLFTLSANTAANLGTAAIVLIAAASWISFGSVLVYIGSRYRLPVMTVLLAAAMLFSLWNDNHEIRSLDKTEFNNRSNVSEHSKQWFNDLNKSQIDHNKNKIPYFIVAAEGGGIRAAYWTALVLSAFQDNNPLFSQHVYAISGVSGGSLGAATFAAVLHEWSKQQPVGDVQEKSKVKCNLNNQPFHLEEASTQQCATAVLSNDFLSPTVAYMLYPDLLQRFLPLSVPMFDRSRALEGSWESGWAKVFPGSETKDETLFSQNFLELWKLQNNSSNNLIPSLFMNSTWVETGKRVITSNLNIDSKTFSDSKDFFNVLKKDVRLSTAAHNSSRFTYVSPAGTVRPPEKEVWGHLVDGGYFENSGATTAYDILTDIIDNNSTGDRFRPVVIVITNDPIVKEPCDNSKNHENKPSENGCEPREFMNELYSPIATMLQTRNARGSYARTEIKNFVTQKNGLYLEIGLCKSEEPLPLGWTLSNRAQRNMEKQLKDYLDDVENNITKFNTLDYDHLKELKKILDKKCK